MGKLHFISSLAAEAAGRVTQDEESWKGFLKTASRLYRYDFDDQLLIYVQRPDATACAPLEMWNEKMRRWIKPGSKGIALIHKHRDGSNRLDYVFDVSDTRPVRGAREPYLWELREEYRAPVLEALERRFGRTGGQDTGERLMQTVAGAVLETFSDHLLDLEYDSGGSPLEGVDVAEWEEYFRETMQASVQYMVLSRCGFRPEDYLEDTSLSGITLFSTPATLHHLGDACSRLAMEICTEIRRAIRRMEQGAAQDREKEARENVRKIAENVLEKPSREVYSESEKKFSAVKRESEERGENGYGRTGTDIQERGGLPDPGPGDGRGGRDGGNAHREVRAAQGELLKGASSRDLHIHAADGEAGGASSGSGEEGPGADRPDPGAADESGRSGREAESIRPDAVGQKSQRHDSPGGGDGAAGSGLQVKQEQAIPEKQNRDRQETAGGHPAVFPSSEYERSGQLSLFPSAEEQVEKIAQAQAEEKREEPAPGQRVKNLPEGLDRCLNSALAGGGNERDSILRIVAFYQKGPDKKQAAAFLEKEFGVGGRGILVDGVKVSVWFDRNGLFFARGNSALVPGAVLVPWERAAARVRTLLERGTFATQDKLDGARDYEYRRQAESMWFLAQNLSSEAREKGYLPYLRELYGGFPDSTEKIAALLCEPGYRSVFCAELDTFAQALQQNPALLRYRGYHPGRIREEIESLDISPRQFHCAEGFGPVKGHFITGDEINWMLRRGSGVSEGKFRIYSYFMQGHDAKECAAFLRTEYGNGGWGQIGYDEWHDSKGIKFKRADDYSGYKGYDTVFFNWNQVQERIRGLIRDGKYLSAREKDYLPEYEKMQLARKLYYFHHFIPGRSGNVLKALLDAEKGAAEFRPVLDSPKYSAGLYEDMAKTFAPLLPEEVREYETMKKALEDMGAFVRGEYSLFQPLPASVLEAERDRTRRRKEAEKEEKRQERQAAERHRDTEAGKPGDESPQGDPTGKQTSGMPGAHEQEGELEKAARALAKKQRAQAGTKQEIDGQLTLDFSAMGASETDSAKEQIISQTAEQVPKSPVSLYREALASLTEAIRRGELYGFLRDRETDYESAAAELEGKLDVLLNDFRTRQPELYHAFQELPKFREWMVEDILERTYQDYAIDGRDAILRHAGEPDAPAWISDAVKKPEKGSTSLGESAKEERREEQEETRKEKKEPQASERQAEKRPDSRLTPHAEEYLALKALHPEKLIGVQVGGLCLFYGKDAEAAAPALDAKLLKREIDGLGETFVTGTKSWQGAVEKALEHGHSILVIGPEPGKGADAPYVTVKEQSVADYIPLGMELTVDGRRMRIDSVDFGSGKVSLKDLAIQGWFPVFREESVAYVRECIEREADREAETEASVGMVLEAAKKTGETAEIDAADLEEAKQLIVDFCYGEYGTDTVDFDSPEHVGIAYTTVGDREYDLQVEVNLSDFSISQFLDGVCVEKRGYGSLRELIDNELKWLEFDYLVSVDPEVLDSIDRAEKTHDGIRKESEESEKPLHSVNHLHSVKSLHTEERQMRASLPSSEQEAEMPAAPQGQLVPSDTVQVFDAGLPFDVAVQKLVTEEEREKERRLRDRRNFRITDDNLGAWGQKTRYQNNAAAVRTLKQIETEGRNATGEEQEILAKYTGWGGLSQAFDPANEKWGKEYAELSGLLTPEEYESARATVLNAFYTSPLVAKAVYAALERMGFVPGNILEPSCGAGNFLGLVPEGFAGAKLYGVELDSLTGRIAAQLYQKADITVGGFETTDYPDSFFDLALGNVPFGDYKVHDRRYDRLNLNIHDYFLVKALDKVRPGGVMAFVTSKGTMDKADGRAREALAQKADLLGAIRLPNNAFKDNADTDVTSDILFFQKRGSAPEKLPDWVAVGKTEDGVPINSYYLRHPEMVLGKMSFWKNMYGNETETACLPREGADLAAQLSEAAARIGQPDRALLEMDAPEPSENGGAGKGAAESIPADPGVRNFSFTARDGKLYYRENSRMALVEPGKKRAERIQNMIGIRDSARRLIEIQTAGASDGEVREEQARLNVLYDSFVKKYGLLSSAGNRQAFRQDSSYPLLCSLEILDEEGKFQAKADIFTKRTIRHRQPVTHADTAVEALGVSIGERACVDLRFMASLMGGPEKIPQIVNDLKGIIFKDPDTGPFGTEGDGLLRYEGWQTQDAYLSGNVREKLEKARKAAGEYPEFAVNVEALEAVQPKDLAAPEINVRIGAPWVDKEYYNEFLYGLLKTPGRLQGAQIGVLYSEAAGAWNVRGKWADSTDNTRVYGTYGTKRANAYAIFEDSLNQRSVEVYDTVEVDGKEKRVLNAKETAIAQQKQEAMKEAFGEWIFKDPERREKLCATYNRLFNAVRPREYDGRHIQFAGMNPEIALEKHQQNAVARVLYGGNTLLAHVVGAGKTYECIAAAMEGKRLGLCQKSMMVVPNHLTEQWGSDFLTLYPGAKVLVATKKDFEPRNRRKFCARIATGDYDAVIIGHTQFEKIPISPERQRAHLQEQIWQIMDGIGTAKAEKQERWTIRQMERTKKSLESRLKRLSDKKRDDTVYFEELGIDRLFVDEAQYYKNLYTYTKMRNVAGIGQADAQKSSDMYAKCQYMDEITGGRGVVFATGTPISNTMVELYTMMRYLQDGMLQRGYKDSAGKVHSLMHFDNWAATFGECVTAVELKPEGTGFRLRTRFARFFNLPELMNMWKEAADIQTADMLDLPTPEVEYVTVQTEASAAQKKMVEALAERAEKIRAGGVDASVDNMLKITSDGRKLALDQRLMNPLLGDDPGSKVNACVENVFRIWQDSTEFQGTQLIFSDLSTPKGKREEKGPEGGNPENAEDGARKEAEKETEEKTEKETGKETEEAPTEENLQEYGVYEDIRQKLAAKGIPKEQIAFIHEAHTEAQKAELFAKVRSGQVRVLLGSTQKMGAGTNVQTRLVASHDLDCPWRPADLEQRVGRIVRRGNRNEKVWIYRYVTKGTFDAYTWGLVESKQKFIGQVMTSKSPARSIEDVDATALSYAEVKMLATGDPRIKEKMDLDIQVTKLKMLKASHTALKYELEDKIRGHFPNRIKEEQLYIDCLQADLPVLEAHPAREEQFSMTIQGITHTERKEAGQALIAACHLLGDPGREVELGEYRGFPMRLGFDGEKFKVTMKQHLTYTAELSDDAVGNIARINNALDKIPQSLKNHEEQMARLEGELENAKEEAEKPFPQEAELAEKSARLTELNTELDNEERNRGKEPEKDGAEREGQESRVAESPGREDTGDRAGKKPSILSELREYERPAMASAVAEREKTAVGR